MDPDAFSAGLFKWDHRGMPIPPPNRLLEEAAAAAAVAPTTHLTPPSSTMTMAYTVGTRPVMMRGEYSLGGLEELLQPYGIRYYTAAKIAELGFTVSTLVHMRDEELDDMMTSLSHIFRWDLLVGERYGVKAAVRAERRRLLDTDDDSRRRQLLFPSNCNALDALSQEGLSEEPVQQEREAAGSGGGGAWEVVIAAAGGHQRKKVEERRRRRRRRRGAEMMRRHEVDQEGDHRQGEEDEEELEDDEGEEEEEEEEEMKSAGHHQYHRDQIVVRQREHPFIVTEPGEVARGKKNGLDYLFHLYDQCREFLIQVQNLAKDRGEKCPTKVTNQVFRYAKKAGASYINKPKMRHYVHCYALHCLDEEGSNALRRSYKERKENVGSWRQACYKPLVDIAGRQSSWDIDAIFNAHPRLSIWYVPTKVRQLCHAERSAATATSSSGHAETVSAAAVTHHHLPF